MVAQNFLGFCIAQKCSGLSKKIFWVAQQILDCPKMLGIAQNFLVAQKCSGFPKNFWVVQKMSSSDILTFSLLSIPYHNDILSGRRRIWFKISNIIIRSISRPWNDHFLRMKWRLVMIGGYMMPTSGQVTNVCGGRAGLNFNRSGRGDFRFDAVFYRIIEFWTTDLRI